MCGILVLSSENNRDYDELFPKALNLMYHRGPNAYGIEKHKGLTFGHRRLSIIDINSNSNQPMQSTDGRYLLVYNGEIYNYLELRDCLSKLGVNFRTKSDTEVLLNSLITWGTEAIPKLNGQWSFYFYDKQEDFAIISRDRFGIKPLYYHLSNNTLIFSSEIKPILSLLKRSPGINYNQMATYFTSGVVDGEEDTFFEGVKRFPPASFLTIKNKVFFQNAIKRYWNYPIERSKRLSKNYEELFYLCSDSVRLSSRSDVDIGVGLSGGLDSSFITAQLYANKTSHSTYSVKYDDKGFNEYEFVSYLTQKLGIPNKYTTPEISDFSKNFDDILWHLEEPAKASGVFSQWQLLSLASKNIKVLLGGQGGDEIFAGYHYYRNYINNSTFRDKIKNTRIMINSNIRNILKSNFQSIFFYSPTVLGSWHPDFYKKYLKKNFFNLIEHSRSLSEKLIIDASYAMLPNLLKYDDKISMAFSVESRVPLLDYRLVDFAFSIYEDDLIKNGQNKYPLVKVLEHLNHNKIAHRRDKMGFSTPINNLLYPIKDKIIKELSNGSLVRHNIIRKNSIAQIVNEKILIQGDRCIWQFLQAEYWIKTFIEGNILERKRFFYEL